MGLVDGVGGVVTPTRVEVELGCDNSKTKNKLSRKGNFFLMCLAMSQLLRGEQGLRQDSEAATY